MRCSSGVGWFRGFHPYPDGLLLAPILKKLAPPAVAHFRGDLWVFMLLFPTPDEQGANYS